MGVLFDPGLDPSRVYYGTDTRIFVILCGVALAFLWRPGRLPARVASFTSNTVDAYGIAALIGLAAVTVAATEDGAFLYRGGFLVVGVLAACLIAACIHPSATLLNQVLARRPLVWLGTRSYSVYLWHWPVFVVTRPDLDVALDGVALFALRIAITLVLAELSFRLVESPVRSGSLSKLWLAVTRGVRGAGLADFRRLTAVGASTGVAVFLAISVAAAEPPPLPSYLQAGHVQTVTWSREDPATPTASPSPSPTSSPTPAPTATPKPSPAGTAAATPVVAAAATKSPPALPTPAPTLPPPTPDPNGPRVFALGDSVMLGASPALQTTIGNLEVDAAVSRQVSEGIGILNWRRDNGLLGDVVVIHLGNNGSFSSGQLEQIMSILTDVERVIFVTVKVPRDWEGPNNGVIAAAAGYANAAVIDWHGIAASNPGFFWDDEIHLRPEGATYYAGLLAHSTVLPD
jgi:hypothetical protein